MQQELATSLKKVVKGTGIVFVGTVLGTFLGFVFRVIVVRYVINGSIFYLTFTPWNNKASKTENVGSLMTQNMGFFPCPWQ